MTSMTTLKLAFASMAALAATPALAGTYNLAGTLSAADPTFNRTLDGNPPSGLSAVGTAVHYDTVSFTVDLTGSYVFLLDSGTGGFDTFLSLYSPTFNPASALTNVLQSNDDLSGSLTQSGFTRSLTAGTSYIAVLTAFSNTGLGAYTFSIDGPGNIATGGTGGVPEPASWAMMIAGFGLVGGAMRRATSIKAQLTFA